VITAQPAEILQRLFERGSVSTFEVVGGSSTATLGADVSICENARCCVLRLRLSRPSSVIAAL